MPSYRIAALRYLALALTPGIVLYLCAGSLQAQPTGPPGQPAAVTTFPAGSAGQAQQTAFPGLREALRAMAKDMPTSRAILTCPISGRQVRVIRTGARWAVFPRGAVFLLLGETEGGSDLVFYSQQQYVQHLARNPAAAKQKPKPLRLPAALRQVVAQKPGTSSASAASSIAPASSHAISAGTH